MQFRYGEGTSSFGPGVVIKLTANEVATAIDAYLVAHGVVINGPRTVTIDGGLCTEGSVFVYPSGFVNADGRTFYGRGPTPNHAP
jgi:hypothetical protein